MALPSEALAESLRAGAAAFGDWREDAPGVARRIGPDNLPPPHATRSSASAASVIARPPGVVPQVPPGFVATLFAAGLDAPRTLRAAPDGSVFVAESAAGRVLRIAADGRRSSFAEGLDGPFGIAFWPPASPTHVYVGSTTRVVRYPWTPGRPAPSGAAQTILADLPDGGHWTRDIAVAPDGARLYLAIGSLSNDAGGIAIDPGSGLAPWQSVHGLGAAWGTETGRAAVFAFDPDGTGLRPFAQGLRNCAGLAVQPATGRPWCATNERDGLGDDLPPDFVTGLTDGAFYNWPWFYAGAHEDPRFRGRRPDLAGRVTLPDVLIQPHSAPLAIAFYTGSLFPAEYVGDAFVTLHGSWNRARRTGYKVVRVRLRDGGATGVYEDFVTGFVLSDDAVWGRPVGIAVAADGALLVGEDAGGTIWRIAPSH